MLAQYLVAASAAIAAVMGLGHLYYTLFTRAFSPRDAELEERMKSVGILLTNRTTVWKGWIGFNASHSMGPILFGFVYGYLALVHGAFLFQSHFLVALGAITLLGYLVLAKVYWFYLPLIGISLALACYVAGVAVAYAG